MKTSRRIAATLFASATLGLLYAGCARQDKTGAHFGEPFTDAPHASIADLRATPDAFSRKPVRVKGAITRQCPMSGCWFILNDGKGAELRVELGDYLPKLPKNIGNTAEVEGELIRTGQSHAFIGTRVTFTKKEAP